MMISELSVNGKYYKNVPSNNLEELGLSLAEINQILAEENIKNKKKDVKALRDELLNESDYLVMPDYPLDDRTAVWVYRQNLRDITLQVDYPLHVTWPDKPEI